MVLQKIKQSNQYRKLQELYKKYERFSLPAFLVGGVVLDAITFRSINLRTAFILLGIYILIAGGTIFFINFYDAGVIKWELDILRYARLYSHLVIQFVFGALLSASLIFYWFSGAFSISWPLILLLAFLMASNDIFRRYYLKSLTQISVYFFILFSVFVLFFSFAFNSVSIWPFILGGVASLVLICLFIYVLSIFVSQIKQKSKVYFIAVGFIFLAMNGLYFLNVIPPIPLSLREAGIYHFVGRNVGGYELIEEKKSFWDKIIPGEKIHIVKNGKIYVFSSVFAPADLKTNIVHRWQRYDEEKKEWVNESRLVFGITGGRDAGYRGYSFKSNVKSGKWRVFVENERGQVLGRIKFEVEIVEDEPEKTEIAK